LQRKGRRSIQGLFRKTISLLYRVLGRVCIVVDYSQEEEEGLGFRVQSRSSE
jgi:hypothetical protein